MKEIPIGIPITEIARRASLMGVILSPNAVKQRLRQRDIYPIGYIGPTGIYPENVVEEVVKNLPIGSRSPKYQRTRFKKPVSAITE